jgi:hypothetical protein
MSKFLDIEDPDIARIGLNLDHQFQIGSRPWQSQLMYRFGVRDFEMSKSLVNENPEIAIRDFAI